MKEAPAHRTTLDAVASGIQAGISPKSSGERASPSRDSAVAIAIARDGDQRRVHASIRGPCQPDQHHERNAPERRPAAHGEHSQCDPGPSRAQRASFRIQAHDEPKSREEQQDERRLGPRGAAGERVNRGERDESSGPRADLRPGEAHSDESREGRCERAGPRRCPPHGELGVAEGASPCREEGRVEGARDQGCLFGGRERALGEPGQAHSPGDAQAQQQSRARAAIDRAHPNGYRPAG